MRVRTAWRGAGPRAAGVAIAVSASLLLGCVPSPRPVPPASFVAYLDDRGEVFTPADPPPGAFSSRAVVQMLEQHPPYGREARMVSPIYGVVTCVRPADCRNEETFAIWLVGYPEVRRANGDPPWVMIDPKSGGLIVLD
jgi:hypothetical protein